jgi:hypothetical protein
MVVVIPCRSLSHLIWCFGVSSSLGCPARIFRINLRPLQVLRYELFSELLEMRWRIILIHVQFHKLLKPSLESQAT